MRNLKSIILFTVFISILSELYSQVNVVSYPVPFSQYYNNFSLINPASIGYVNELSADMGHKRFLGNFSKISTYYFSADYRITKSNSYGKKPFSALGVYLINDREGKYLNRARAYAVYAWHGFLFKDLRFSGGFRIGGMNYNVKGTPLSGDGSDTSPDGSVGLWMYNSKFSIGAAYHQMFNSTIQPLEEVAYLKPYLNVMGKSNLFNNELFQFDLAGNVFIPVSDEYTQSTWDITGKGTIREKVAVVAGIHNRNRLMSSIEILDMFNSESKINMCLTYCYAFQTSVVSNNFFELGLSYSLR